MSSRVLRKLQGERGLEISRDYEEDEDEFSILPVKTKQKIGVNRFDLVKLFFGGVCHILRDKRK